VYDYLRSQLQATLAGRQQAQAAAHQAVVAAQGTVATSTSNLSTATNTLNSARAAVVPAQSQLSVAQAAQAQRAQAAANAQAALNAWEEQEPEQYLGGAALAARRDDRATMLPGGGYPRPNPAYAAWLRQYNVLKAARDAANTQLAAANTAVSNAQGAVNSANAQVASAQNAVTARTQELAAANQALTTSQSTEASAAVAVTAAQASLSSLDARAARLTATPLDRAGVSAMADEEQAEVSRLRTVRKATRTSRHTAAQTRARLLTEHDGSIAALKTLADALHGWSDATYPDPPAVGTLLDAVVGSATAQAAANPRVDDLASMTTQVQAALARFQATVDAANRDRDAKAAALQAAQVAVTQVLADAP
jgi:chromosome segregation ATPase